MSVDNRAEWRLGRVVESVPVARDIRRITIERPGAAAGRARPGTHLDVRVQLEGGEDLRSYSVVESDDVGRLLTISVLRVPESRGGSVFMHGLQVGDALMTTQPLQNFPMRVGAVRYVLVAGGVGITALVAMARVLRDLKADYSLVYVGRSREQMAYLSSLADLHGERLEVHVDDEGSSLDITALVAGVAADPRAPGTEMYVCGPIRLMDGVRRAWAGESLPPANLRFETFGSSGWFDAEEFVVRVPQLGVETTVGSGSTMLEALTAAGADLMYDCRKGECGLCRVDIGAVDGVIDHRDVFLSERQKERDDAVCICVSRVVSGPDGRAPALTLTLP